MAPFVAPSGGDWSAHVGGAVIFNGTVSCTLSASTISSVGGSGVALTGYNRAATITGNEFAWLGEGEARRARLRAHSRASAHPRRTRLQLLSFLSGWSATPSTVDRAAISPRALVSTGRGVLPGATRRTRLRRCLVDVLAVIEGNLGREVGVFVKQVRSCSSNSAWPLTAPFRCSEETAHYLNR